MKKQIIVINGGTSFRTYENYISYLKEIRINIEKLKIRRSWRDTLAAELGDAYEILVPRMPNSTNARYAEWKIWFNNITEVLNDEVIIIIGHSLGGVFLAKYLSENTFPKKITATILIAPPFEDVAGAKESLTDFVLPSSLAKFAKQGGKIYLVHSKDDPIVPVTHLYKYQQSLPEAEAIIFENREHFNQETFPEIIELIKSI